MSSHIDRALKKIKERLSPSAKIAKPQSDTIDLSQIRQDLRQLQDEKQTDLDTIQDLETTVAELDRKVADLNSEKCV